MQDRRPTSSCKVLLLQLAPQELPPRVETGSTRPALRPRWSGKCARGSPDRLRCASLFKSGVQVGSAPLREEDVLPWTGEPARPPVETLN